MEITKELLFTEWVTNRKSQREIAEEYSVGLWKIENLIKEYALKGARTKIKYPIDHDKISLDNPRFWYLVGLIISDGYINDKNQRVIISLRDYQILEVLSDYFSGPVKTPIYRYKVKGESYKYNLTLSDEYLVGLLESIGIPMTDKTATVNFPDPGNISCFNMLVRGFLDGDGNIRTKSDGKFIEYRFYSHSPKLVEDFKRLVLKYHNVEVYDYVTSGKSGKTITSKTKDGDYLIDIYDEYPEFSISRKRDTIKTYIDDIYKRYQRINLSNWNV